MLKACPPEQLRLDVDRPKADVANAGSGFLVYTFLTLGSRRQRRAATCPKRTKAARLRNPNCNENEQSFWGGSYGGCPARTCRSTNRYEFLECQKTRRWQNDNGLRAGNQRCSREEMRVR